VIVHLDRPGSQRVSFESQSPAALFRVRQPDVAALLVEHELRVRSECAVLMTEALERAERLPTLPIDELVRMVVAVTESADIQVLTDMAAGAKVRAHLGPRAVMALLRHFSVPTESMISPEHGASQ